MNPQPGNQIPNPNINQPVPVVQQNDFQNHVAAARDIERFTIGKQHNWNRALPEYAIPLSIARQFITWNGYQVEELPAYDVLEPENLVPDTRTRLSMNLNTLIRSLILEEELSDTVIQSWLSLFSQVEVNRIAITLEGEVNLLNTGQPNEVFHEDTMTLLDGLHAALYTSWVKRYTDPTIEAIESNAVKAIFNFNEDMNPAILVALSRVRVGDVLLTPSQSDLTNWVQTTNFFRLLTENTQVVTKVEVVQFILCIHALIRGMKPPADLTFTLWDEINRTAAVYPNFREPQNRENIPYFHNPTTSTIMRAALPIFLTALLPQPE